jgi:hypothetical protein
MHPDFKIYRKQNSSLFFFFFCKMRHALIFRSSEIKLFLSNPKKIFTVLLQRSTNKLPTLLELNFKLELAKK